MKKRSKTQRGQSLTETALIIPVLLLVLSGLVEFGLFLNQYLALQDSTRNAARFAADSLYYVRDSDPVCDTTRDFFRQAACLVSQELRQDHPLIVLSDNGTPNDPTDDILDPARGDEILISVFTVTSGSPTRVTARFPQSEGEMGWSYAIDSGHGSRNATSHFSNADIEANIGTSIPSTGFVLVEIIYHYDHMLGLPWLTAFIPDPIELHAYSLMPNVSAEPTSTPLP